jgi:ribosomal protein S13
MATVGNLFVNVGASTRGLEQGLKRGQDQVRKFAADSNKAAASVAGNIPGVDALYARASQMRELMNGFRGMWDSFNGGVKAAAAEQAKLTKAIEDSKAAQQALASAKGTRRNIGQARAMLAQAGINPDQAARQLATTDTTAMREKVAAATKMVADAQRDLNAAQAASKDATSAKLANDLAASRGNLEQATAKVAQEQARLAGAQAFADRAAKGQDPYTGRFLKQERAMAVQAKAQKELQAQAARTEQAIAKQAEAQEVVNSLMSGGVAVQGAKAVEQAQQRLTQATKAQADAQRALGKVRDENQRKEAMRGKLRGMGIDLTKGQAALRLPSLAPFQSAAAEASKRAQDLGKEIADAAKGFKVFGLSVGKALGPVGLIAAGLVAATAGALTLTKAMAKQMGALEDQAVASGFSVEGFQRLEQTYRDLGAAAGTVEMASQRLSFKLQEAVDGSEDAQESFARLGLDFRKLAAGSPEQAFEATLAAVRRLGNSREQVAALRDVFGKGGIGLAAAARATSDALAEADARARRLTIPAGVVATLAAADDKADQIGKTMTKLQALFAFAMAPVLESLGDSVMEMFATDPGAWIGGFQSIALVLAGVYDIVAALVNAFAAMWNVVQAIGGVINGVIMGALGAVLKAVQAIVYGIEWLLGSANDISEAIGDAASVTLGAAGESMSAAGEDAAEALQRGIDAVKPDATMAVMEGIARGWQQTTASMEGNPATLAAKVDRTAIKEVERELDALRSKLEVMQVGEADAAIAKMQKAGASESQIAEARALQQQIAALEQIEAGNERIRALNDEIAKATMTAAEFAEYEAVTKQGLSMADAAQVRVLQEQLDLLEKQKAARDEIASTVEDLQQRVNALGMTEAQILTTKMQQLGATDAQIAQAQQLQAILDAAKVDDALKQHFNALETRLLDAQGNQEEILRRQLEGMGLAGDALEDALARTLDIEAQITEAERLKANQEQVAGTLQDLTNQLDKLKLGEAGYLEKQLREAGASQQEIAKALAMQSEIASLEQAGKADATVAKAEEMQAVTDTIGTAIGGMKLAGVVSAGERVQRDLLSESEMQTGLLGRISTAMEAMVGSGKTPGSGILFAEDQPQAIASTVPAGLSRQEADMTSLMKQGNEYLKQIVGNTAAFAGVLT